MRQPDPQTVTVERLLTPTQEAFRLDRRRLSAFLSGYGGGKTYAGATKAWELAAANDGCAGLIVAPTWRMLERLSLEAFHTVCPSVLIRAEHKSERRIDCINGARVYFGSADNPGSLEGMNLAWFWIDEARLVSVEAWRVLLGRLREKRARLLQGFVTTTPAMGWLADEFGGGRADRAVFRCSTLENARNLAPGFIDDLRRSYSARLARSLIDGEFSAISGQVYEEFDAAKHLVEWRYRPDLPLWLSWDFGVRAASILVAQWTGDFATRDAAGREIPPRSIVVFDELQPEQVATAHQIPRVRALLKASCGGAAPWAVVCDPAGNQRDQATGMPSVALLRAEFGDIVRWATAVDDRHIPNRIARVCGALAPVEGPPRLYFARGLTQHAQGTPEARRGVIAMLRGSTYPEKAGRVSSDHPADGEYEHARDTLDYLVVGAQNAYGERRQPPRRLALV